MDSKIAKRIFFDFTKVDYFTYLVSTLTYLESKLSKILLHGRLSGLFARQNVDHLVRDAGLLQIQTHVSVVAGLSPEMVRKIQCCRNKALLVFLSSDKSYVLSLTFGNQKLNLILISKRLRKKKINLISSCHGIF